MQINEDGTMTVVEAPRVGHPKFVENKPEFPDADYVFNMIINVYFRQKHL